MISCRNGKKIKREGSKDENYLYLLINPVKFFKQVAEKEKVSLLIPILIIAIIGCLTGVIAGNVVGSMDLPADQMGMVKTISIVTGIISGIISVKLLPWW